jgi:RecD/TraA family predicted helicase
MAELLVGTVERITYYNPENGYTVAQVVPEGRSYTVTVVGSLLEASAGECLRLHGQWSSHPRFGRQFQVERYETVLPATVAGIEKYLGSGLIKGIGPVTARRIVRRFKFDTLRVIEEEPGRLREVLGVGKHRVALIQAAWAEQKAIKEVMLFLQSHDVSTSHAVKIFKTYGDASIEVVRSDPYRLARDIYGIGFLTADKIASALGLAHDSPQRVQAGIAYTLGQMADDGHVYAPQGELIHQSTQILEVPPELVAEGIGRLAQEQQVYVDPRVASLESGTGGRAVREEQAVYLAPFYYGELGAANRLKTILNEEKSRLAFYSQANLDRVMDHLAEEGGPVLNDGQREAVRAALTHKVTVLTGGPGTGKTTAVRTIIRLLEASELCPGGADRPGRQEAGRGDRPGSQDDPPLAGVQAAEGRAVPAKRGKPPRRRHCHRRRGQHARSASEQPPAQGDPPGEPPAPGWRRRSVAERRSGKRPGRCHRFVRRGRGDAERDLSPGRGKPHHRERPPHQPRATAAISQVRDRLFPLSRRGGRSGGRPGR